MFEQSTESPDESSSSHGDHCDSIRHVLGSLLCTEHVVSDVMGALIISYVPPPRVARYIVIII